MSAPTTVTHEALAKAFEAWETDFRINPEGYIPAEECAEMGVSQLSADRATHLLFLLTNETP